MPDTVALSSFIQLSQQAMTQGRGGDAIERTLYAGDQNLACQLVGSLSQILNTMGTSTQQAATSG